MTEPISLQLNVLQGQDMARQSQEAKDVSAHQQIGQEADRAKESEDAPKQVQPEPESREAKMDKDGSGRGRGFLRRRRGEKEAPPEEKEEDRPQEPQKGERVDFVR